VGRTCVEVRGLTVSIQRRTILEEVSFSVCDEVLGIAGPNGSGKSTLLRSIERAAWRQNDAVRIGDPAMTAPRVGYLPQGFDMPKGMTVREFVEYAAWIKNSATVRASAAEAIEAAQLGAFADRRLGHVSGGVAQRTGFASVLVDAPDVLLLDEPTTGVDIHQREVMREIIAAQSPGRTTILSSHIAEDLEQLCDRILVLVKGRPRFLGSVDEARAETGEETLSGALLSLTAGVE